MSILRSFFLYLPEVRSFLLPSGIYTLQFWGRFFEVPCWRSLCQLVSKNSPLPLLSVRRSISALSPWLEYQIWRKIYRRFVPRPCSEPSCHNLKKTEKRFQLCKYLVSNCRFLCWADSFAISTCSASKPSETFDRIQSNNPGFFFASSQHSIAKHLSWSLFSNKIKQCRALSPLQKIRKKEASSLLLGKLITCQLKMKPFENNDVTSLWIFGSMIISWSCACSETLSGPCEWRKLQREYERQKFIFRFFHRHET